MKLNIIKYGRKLLASATIAVALVALSGVSAQADADDNASILYLVNQYRYEVGSPSVTEDAQLDEFAQYRADEAAQRNMIQHDVNYWYNRLGNVNGFGEVLAQNRSPAGSVVAWKNSGSHYPIMVDAKYKKVGIGFATSATGQPFAVMVLVEPAAAPPAASAPLVPNNVQASYSSGIVTASWSQPESGNAPTDYVAYLYRDGTQVATKMVSATSNSASFSNVQRGSSYTVTAQSFSSATGRASSESAQSASIVAPATAPETPALSPFASVGAGDLLTYWNTPNGNGADVTGYQLRIYRDGQQVDAQTTTSAYFRYTPTQRGVYQVDVSAVNSVGSSIAASSTSFNYTPAEVPQPTSSAQAPAPVSVPRAVEQASHGEVSAISTSSNSTSDLTGVSTPTPVVSSAPTQPTPAVSSAPTQPTAPKPNPTSTTKPQPVRVPSVLAKPSVAAKSGGAIVVRWNATKAGGSNITKYQLRIQFGSVTKVYGAATSARMMLISKLGAKKLVKVWIRAANAGGWSAYSAAQIVKTKP